MALNNYKLGDLLMRNSEENKDEAPEAVPMKLTKGMICTIFGLLETGYTFGRIKINRDIDAKQVKKKIASILACKGIISPLPKSGAGTGRRKRKSNHRGYPEPRSYPYCN